MPATFATSDWLRRVAENWALADAADDSRTKRTKQVLAQGCERIAHHVAAPLRAELMPQANTSLQKPSLAQSLARSLVALLATPFLLLAVLIIGCWLQLSGRLPDHPMQQV
jgi:hypothetical protein